MSMIKFILKVTRKRNGLKKL